MPSTSAIFHFIVLLAVLAATSFFAASRTSPDADTLAANADQQPITIANDSLHIKKLGGIKYLADTPFTGIEVAYYEDGRLAAETHYVDGRRNGPTTRWFPNGVKSFASMYKADQRHGLTQTWWSNGTLRASSNYIDGVAHGLQQQWYKSGALFKALNVRHGKSHGLQRAWRGKRQTVRQLRSY